MITIKLPTFRNAHRTILMAFFLVVSILMLQGEKGHINTAITAPENIFLSNLKERCERYVKTLIRDRLNLTISTAERTQVKIRPGKYTVTLIVCKINEKGAERYVAANCVESESGGRYFYLSGLS